jgi:hypothetical protein
MHDLIRKIQSFSLKIGFFPHLPATFEVQSCNSNEARDDDG